MIQNLLCYHLEHLFGTTNGLMFLHIYRCTLLDSKSALKHTGLAHYLQYVLLKQSENIP